MSNDFGLRKEITARCTHLCQQCKREIKPGIKHFYFVGKFQSEFYFLREHLECNAAFIDFLNITGIKDDEMPSSLYGYADFTQDDKDWLAEKHPIVFARLYLPKIDNADAE